MKRILIDENLPPSLVKVFQAASIEAFHICDFDLRSGNDRAIWAQATILDAAVVTKDSDFLDIATLSPNARVILYQLGNARLKDVIAFTATHLPVIAAFLESEDRFLVLRREDGTSD